MKNLIFVICVSGGSALVSSTRNNRHAWHLFQSEDAVHEVDIRQINGWKERKPTELPRYPIKDLPSKSDLYSIDELEKLLSIHNQISTVTSQKLDNDGPVPQSLHDMVLSALTDLDSVESDKSTDQAQPLSDASQLQLSSNYTITPEMQHVLPNIVMIASDVDGTLLTSDHKLHAYTERAIRNVVRATHSSASKVDFFCLATGKSRAGALRSLGVYAELVSKSPGVFLQGLYCVDANGQVLYEKKLAPASIIQQAADLADELRTSLFCYDGDGIQATPSSSSTHMAEFHEKWGETEPQRFDNVADYKDGFHKLLFMDDDPEKMANIVRPRLEELASRYNCVVTQAVPTMLELLPPGSSKAVGVEKLCAHLGVDPSTQLLAIGDAENDIGMLEMAAFGIAIGNAGPGARRAANLVLEETNDQGGAGIAIELFGLNKILADKA